MTTRSAAGAVFPFVREPPGDFCLGFVNTKYWRGAASPTEQLRTPADLLGWWDATALWPAALIAPVRARWEAHPAEGAAAFAAALALREALFRLFSATAAGTPPDAADLDLFNAALAAAPARTCLRRHGDGFVWELPGPFAGAAAPLAPVLWSAGDLLAGDRLARVRQCANPQCRWLFLDDSKSGNRRWCSMAACGNRAKAHRHYARRRAPAP